MFTSDSRNPTPEGSREIPPLWPGWIVGNIFLALSTLPTRLCPSRGLGRSPAPHHTPSPGQAGPRSPPRPPGRVTCSGLRALDSLLIPHCPLKTEYCLGQEPISSIHHSPQSKSSRKSGPRRQRQDRPPGRGPLGSLPSEGWRSFGGMAIKGGLTSDWHELGEVSPLL